MVLVLKLMNGSKYKHCCEFCGKKYEKNHALQEHIDKLHAAGDQEKSEKSCLCPDCGKVLKFKNRLKHLKLCQTKEKKQKIMGVKIARNLLIFFVLHATVFI